ncbi:nucleotide exchange factor GrpE [Thermogutta sp.]|uniref:nucleotide exchange factor GrpE n=1 Tax=Thermogutta sp. TaxID=1962930 RepID=UPI00321FBD4F
MSHIPTHEERERQEVQATQTVAENTAEVESPSLENENQSEVTQREKMSNSVEKQSEVGASGSMADQEQLAAGETALTAEDYEKQIAALKQEVEDFRNRAMRWQAELENYQKRIARQLVEERKYAAIELIRDLLPVYDNLQRAAQSAEQNHDVGQLLQGIRMILKQWEDVLARHECRKIEALHQPFDPNLHHAISRQATGDVPPNTVLYVAQDGFVLHDRVVRPSQVVVSMALPGPGGEGASEPVEPGASEEPSNNHPPA